MNNPRIVKKYPNRRLYDTSISKYITLMDVKRLVIENTHFEVIDVKTEDDITRSILLQIIIEQEEQGDPILSSEVLAQLIRFYGGAMQGVIGRYLEKSLGLFVQQQQHLQEQMGNLVNQGPLGTLTELTQRNFRMWTDMQEGLMQAMTLTETEQPDSADDEKKEREH